VQFTFQNSGLPFTLNLSDSDQSSNRFIAAGDNDFFSGCGLFDEPGKIRLSFKRRNEREIITRSADSGSKWPSLD
jgi:hypothetical protein